MEEDDKIGGSKGYYNPFIDSSWIYPYNVYSFDTLIEAPKHIVTQDDNLYKLDMSLPDVKANEINIELEKNKLHFILNTESQFVYNKNFTIDLGCEVEYNSKAILEYGVLKFTFNKIQDKKTIKVVEP